MPKVSKLLIFSAFLTAFLTMLPRSSAIYAAPAPCTNPVITPENNLTDNYITKDKGEPFWEFNVQATGQPGATVSLPTTNLTFTLDFSKLQAIFGSANSDYLEGKFQDPNHQSANVNNMDAQNRNELYGPGQKAAPMVMTDMLKVKYVDYVLNHAQLPEAASAYTDINGQNPSTISNMVTTLNFPNPPNPPRLGGDPNIWAGTWGTYWEKIPTAYNEFYQGKIEFRSALSFQAINDVRLGNFCPLGTPRTINFVMPDFFRTTAISGQLNQIVVPKSAQSPNNNVILASAEGVKNAIANFVNTCVHLATQNPVSNELKKIISFAIKNINLTKPAYADSCVMVPLNGKKGNAPYCALPASELKAGDSCADIPNDPNKLDTANSNVICTFSIAWTKNVVIPATGNDGWDNCTNTNPRTCTAHVAVWPDVRIPWLADIWNNSTFSDQTEDLRSLQITGRPGEYTTFTPKAVHDLLFPTKLETAIASLQKCYPQWPSTTPIGDQAACDVVNSAGFVFPCPGDQNDLVNIANCIAPFINKVMPGEVANAIGDDKRQRLIGSTDCSKVFIRDMALKPIELQRSANVDTACVPKPQTVSIPITPSPVPSPTPSAAPLPTPTPIVPTPTPVSNPTPTPGPSPTPPPTPTPTPTPSPSPSPTPNISTLTFSWARPIGFASFVDAGSKISSCSSSGTSCSTPTFTYWPGSSLIYNVRVTGPSGPIIQSGGTTATLVGQGSVSWNWSYTAVVFPASFSNCLAAGAQCKTQTVNDNNATAQTTIAGLQTTTNYNIVVCAPNCGTGVSVLSKTQTSTP